MGLLDDSVMEPDVKLRLHVANAFPQFVGDERAQDIMSHRRIVTSRDLQWLVTNPETGKLEWQDEHPHFEVAHFASEEERAMCHADEGITIVKLGQAQSLSLECDARVGIGRMHYKWSPACVCAMSYEPVVKINTEVAEAMSAEEKVDFVQRCQPGVFDYRTDKEQIVCTADAEAVLNNPIEIETIGGEIAKAKGMSENLISITYKPNTFVFDLETSGCLTPFQVVTAALQVMRKKLHVVAQSCGAMAAGATGAGSGVLQ
jgi:DNA-directed RNA polymerase alpha subunit